VPKNNEIALAAEQMFAAMHGIYKAEIAVSGIYCF